MLRIPIASDGWRFILPLAFAGAALLFLASVWAKAIGVVLLILAAFCLSFFRDFERVTPQDDGAIYSPGDGRVTAVEIEAHAEFEGWKVIRIFLSVFDVHVQRSPVSGRVEKLDYHKGAYLDARHPEAHLKNEQNTLLIASSRGSVAVKQVAGLIARRIVCWAKVGSGLKQGERYGLIRFGSQVQVLMPAGVNTVVKVGDRVVGGKTVLARWA